MDDINANTAVLSIYDPVFDYNDTNTITKIDDIRLIKNNHTEACFTRVPELQSLMPICEVMLVLTLILILIPILILILLIVP